MRNETRSGILLIAGTLAGLLTMLLHPTAHDLVAPGEFARQAALAAFVHGLALVAIPVTFLGFLGLARRLGPSDLTAAALVAYAWAAVAVLAAAVASGFVAPSVISHSLAAQGAEHDVQQALLAYTGLVNQGFSKVYAVASAVAILLWSIAILRTRRLARAAGAFGIVVAVLVALAVLSGHLRLGVHGFGAVVLAEGIWTVWVGVLLCRKETAAAADASDGAGVTGAQ